MIDVRVGRRRILIVHDETTDSETLFSLGRREQKKQRMTLEIKIKTFYRFIIAVATQIYRERSYVPETQPLQRMTDIVFSVPLIGDSLRFRSH